MQEESILILVIRGTGWADHPAAPDLELLLERPPGVVALGLQAGAWVCIVLHGCPPEVEAAAHRLIAGPLPDGVTRILER